jgi:quinol monooxygenase YgiN
MLVYEVNLAVEAGIADAFAAWLPGHVAELLALPGFVSADIFRIEEPAPPAGEVALSVRYRLRDRAALDAYLNGHAPRLRAEGIARFGGRFRAERRVLSAFYDPPSGV